MPKPKSDYLFRLIKSLKKSEKRYFKLFVSREDRNQGKKFLLLFDLIDQQEQFDEDSILENTPSIDPAQLSNIKAHLYKRVLQSLRLYDISKVAELEIRELIDHSVILYNRCLYEQCHKMLEKAKKKAAQHENLELLLEIYKWEKKVLVHTIGRENQKRVNKIVGEVQDLNQRINHINTFTNLMAKLNSFYLKEGFVRNQKHYEKVRRFLFENLPKIEEKALSFNEKLHYYELMTGYFFFVQDFEKGHSYAKKWVELFEKRPSQVASQLEMYIKGLNNLMIAQYKLMLYHDFVEAQKKMKAIRHSNKVLLNEDIQTKLFKYHYVHEFNRYFMLGDFTGGVAHFNKIKGNLEVYIDRVDRHSRIVMYYKIACLHFGINDHSAVVQWLHKIINLQDIDLREDVHCFARILNLISHYELGNSDVIEYYLRSTYRFLLKKDDLQQYQQYILKFMKQLNRSMTSGQLLEAFKKLLQQLQPLTQSPYEKRAFIYFDIISWLEAKIHDKTVEFVIKEKARKTIERQAPVPQS